MFDSKLYSEHCYSFVKNTYLSRFCQVDAVFTLILLVTSTVNLSERFRVLESRTTSSVNYGCDAKNRSSSGSLSRRAPNSAARFTS